MTYRQQKILAVIAVVDCTLVCVFKLSMRSITRLTRKFGLIIESFGISHVIQNKKIYFMHQKVNQLQTFNELNDKANAKFDIWPAFINLT